MNNIVDFYSKRPVVIIDAKKFADPITLPDYQFRNLVVVGESGGSELYSDFGSLCYLKKTKLILKTHSCNVVEQTLDKTLEKLLDLLVKNRLGTLSATSVRNYFNELKAFSSYYFEKLSHLDFNDYSACVQSYKDTTEFLLLKKANLLASSKKCYSDFLKLTLIQRIFAESVCLLHSEDLNKFQAIAKIVTAVRLPRSVSVVRKEELIAFYDFNKKIFYALRDFLMEKKQYPFVFSSEYESQIIYYPHSIESSNFFREYPNLLFKENGFVRTRSEFKNVVNKYDEVTNVEDLVDTRLSLMQNYDKYQNWLIQSNADEQSRGKATLINYAITAFSMCFFCESSINQQQLLDLKLDDLSDFSSSTKGVRVSVLKARAGYKEIELLIAAPMLPLLKDYKEFRSWVLSFTTISDIDNFVFELDVSNGSKDCFKVSNFSANKIMRLRKWIKSFIADFRWIAPQVIRRTVGTVFFNETKSIIATSKKLGNTPSVVGRHYVDASESEHSEQMDTFFEELHEKISNKYRKNKDIITVHIDETGTTSTPAGSCKTQDPKKRNEFTDDLATPNCSNFASCLFCENYVVHSGKEDIRKLMSLKKISMMSGETEESLVMIKRINEILKILLDKYPEKKEDFFSVAESVQCGELDEFWQDHLNMLLDLKVDFYD